jgi:hypothetical protein
MIGMFGTQPRTRRMCDAWVSSNTRADGSAPAECIHAGLAEMRGWPVEPSAHNTVEERNV